jgi:hypothetical protein
MNSVEDGDVILAIWIFLAYVAFFSGVVTLLYVFGPGR